MQAAMKKLRMLQEKDLEQKERRAKRAERRAEWKEDDPEVSEDSDDNLDPYRGLTPNELFNRLQNEFKEKFKLEEIKRIMGIEKKHQNVLQNRLRQEIGQGVSNSQVCSLHVCVLC